MPDEEPRGSIDAGGGVVLAPPILLDSENVSQKFLPFEFFIACCLKLLERPAAKSPIMSSSGIWSSDSCWFRLGDEAAVLVAGGSALTAGTRGSGATSLSRTCLMTSASCRTSVSAGAVSSAKAARIRAKFFVFGYGVVSQVPDRHHSESLTKRFPRRLVTRRTIVL